MAKRTGNIAGLPISLDMGPEEAALAGGVILLAYFGIVKPVLNKLGITKSAEDRKLQQKNEKADTSKGWDPTFYKSAEATKPKRILFTHARAVDLAKQIHSAWGFFNDNENKVVGAVNACASLSQLSQLCAAYQEVYQQDLLSRINASGTFMWLGSNGLTKKEKEPIINHVNSLPVNVYAK